MLALAIIVVGCIGCKLDSKPASSYFAQIHIGEPVNEAQVQAFIVFDRMPELDVPAGLAHYAEHLVAMSALADDFRAADRHANAYTSATTVGYWVKGPKADLPLIIKNLTGVFNPISLDVDFANEEVDIVRREYDLRRINNIDYRAYEAMTPYLFEGNRIGGKPYSTPQSIAALDYEQAVTYYNKTHQQSSAVLLVLGDVTDAQVKKAVEASGIQPLTNTATEIRPNTYTLAEHDAKNFTFEISSAEPRIIFRKLVALEPARNFDLLALQTAQLSAVLDTNLPGGIAAPLRYDNFIARNFELTIYPLDEQHIEIWFEANPDAGVTFRQLQLAFEDALKAAAKGIPESTYERVQARFNHYWVDWEDADATTEWMSSYARVRVTNLRTPLTLKELKKMTEQISISDINTLLKAMQEPGRQAVAYIGIDNGENQ